MNIRYNETGDGDMKRIKWAAIIGGCVLAVWMLASPNKVEMRPSPDSISVTLSFDPQVLSENAAIFVFAVGEDGVIRLPIQYGECMQHGFMFSLVSFQGPLPTVSNSEWVLSHGGEYFLPSNTRSIIVTVKGKNKEISYFRLGVEHPVVNVDSRFSPTQDELKAINVAEKNANEECDRLFEIAKSQGISWWHRIGI